MTNKIKYHSIKRHCKNIAELTKQFNNAIDKGQLNMARGILSTINSLNKGLNDSFRELTVVNRKGGYGATEM